MGIALERSASRPCRDALLHVQAPRVAVEYEAELCGANNKTISEWRNRLLAMAAGHLDRKGRAPYPDG